MDEIDPWAARVFKTAWFAKAAKKARIGDAELDAAVRDVASGLADDLGGGVFKKRLKKNEYRAVILTKVDRIYVFEYLFAKKDRANIGDDELRRFRVLSKAYGKLSDLQLSALLDGGDFTEIFGAGES